MHKVAALHTLLSCCETVLFFFYHITILGGSNTGFTSPKRGLPVVLHADICYGHGI